MFDDTTGVIRNRKLKDKQFNGRKKMDKLTTNHLQNTTQKTKVRVYFCKYLSSNRMFYQMTFYKTLVIAKISLLFLELLLDVLLAA